MEDLSFATICIVLGTCLSLTLSVIGKLIIDGIREGNITSWDTHLIGVGLCIVISLILVLRHLAKG